MSTDDSPREIPFNYTSAGDAQVVRLLLGAEAWNRLQILRGKRVTGRSARLLMRFLGEVFVHRRNAYLMEEVVTSETARRRLLGNLRADLAAIEEKAGEPEVFEVLGACRRLLAAFRREIEETLATRERIRKGLGDVVGHGSVLFDPFTLVSHATDATDWRLHLPVAVVRPSREEQVAPLLAAIARMGLGAIPRGAGTGLTGGAVPLKASCVVVNTEALNRIRGVEERDFPAGGPLARCAVMEVEAGVVTERAMDFAAARGFVFATDPTSAWACTVGGNIAENAGGKTAVLWGTCIDNLLSWRMAMPSGESWTVTRDGHPLRKIRPDDELTYRVMDGAGREVRTIVLRGSEVRKPGLWKDITNKALGGLPGLQKEGTDGIVTSATFILHRRYEASATLCLEFFGRDFDEASRVILDLSRALPDEGRETLQALEHFDDEYVRAISYRTKAARAGTPKAVLLVDVVGHTGEECSRGVERVSAVVSSYPGTEMFVARDGAEARYWWTDRKKLGAIARRTNAFKLNEDIVLPLPALAPFARFCEARNAEEERAAQATFARAAVSALLALVPAEDADRWERKGAPATRLRDEALASLDAASPAVVRSLALAEQLRADLLSLSRGVPGAAEAAEKAWAAERRRRIVLATHMHAGDGNVHVNVPVLSNDQAMMRRAGAAIDDVMAEVERLGGVCSGEHGIGVTKLRYLDPARVAELRRYRAGVDPAGTMNPGKLDDLPASLSVFTPSFNLLELEARILTFAGLEELAGKVATCVRCGRCKADCCVFHPAKGLHYHPRNKNLAIGALVEALLYQAQRFRSARFRLLPLLAEVADHCTLCHKCAKPCPVDIDTAEVSVLERTILSQSGVKATPLPTRLSLAWLGTNSPAANRLGRAALVSIGGGAQRAGARLASLLPSHPVSSGLLALLAAPLPRADPGTLRDLLSTSRPDEALVLEPAGEARATVFYFPGCGSERLYSNVSAAAVHVLLETGTRVVLPPAFLCCGFPHRANARIERHDRTVLRDVIVFAQVREMLGHLSFNAVVVTCGTCREALDAMEAGKVFGASVMDAIGFAFSRGLVLPKDGRALYHAPCHDSLGGKGAEVVRAALGIEATEVPHCCSEAGTLALSRPDIAGAMRHRKREALAQALGAPGALAEGPPTTILTNCPSCLQGLGRNADLGITAEHVAVAAARRLSGKNWRSVFAERARSAIPIRL